MSFTAESTGRAFAPGYFLADDEACLRETADIQPDHAQVQDRDGAKVVPAGSVIPANSADAVGILYEDIDVTHGAAPGSVVTRGVVYGNRLPAAIDSAAAGAMKGITVKEAPEATRPAAFDI